MNTWYEKKDVYKYTWQHPGSTMWYCIRIDYVLMRQSQRTFYWDVSIIRSADCWTDHKLLRAKITLQLKSLVARQHVRCRFAAYKLRDRNVGIAFNEEVIEKVNSMWSDMSTLEKWNTIRDGFVAGAVVLGVDCFQQPDCFKDSAETLQPLIASHNALFKQWLH